MTLIKDIVSPYYGLDWPPVMLPTMATGSHTVLKQLPGWRSSREIINSKNSESRSPSTKGTCCDGDRIGVSLNKGDISHQMADEINHPSHYTSGGIECWDAMRSARGDFAHVEYCIQTAIKYLYRCGKKDNKLEDMQKAEAFLNRAIKIEAKEI